MQTFYTILAILALCLGLPVLILLVVDRIRYPQRKLSQEQREAERKRRSECFRQPNFEEAERTCGGAIPKRLKLAYEQSDLILVQNVDFTPPGKDPEKHLYWIQDFVPMDAEGQSHTTDLSDFGIGCCFAGDGSGNFYWTPVSDSNRTTRQSISRATTRTETKRLRTAWRSFSAGLRKCTHRNRRKKSLKFWVVSCEQKKKQESLTQRSRGRRGERPI